MNESDGASRRAAAAEQRAELAREIIATEIELYTCHQGDLTPSPRPPAEEGAWYQRSPTEAPDLAALTVAIFEDLAEGLPWHRIAARRRTRVRAAAEAVAMAEREARQLEAERDHARQEAEALSAEQADAHETMLEALDDALADGDAVVERVEAGIAIVRMLVPPVESLIGAQEPVVTSSGRMTVHKRTASRRHLLYAAVLASRCIRITKVAFASVQELRGVRITIDQMADQEIRPIYTGLIRRSARIFWTTDVADPEVLARALPAAAQVAINLHSRTGELRPIEAEPVVTADQRGRAPARV